MKKWISVALATFCTVSFAEATILEEMNEYIAKAPNPTSKQIVICEREANHIYEDPQQCIKAADMLLEMSKKVTKNSLLRCELRELSEENCKLSFKDTYQMTDEEFFSKFISQSYYNAGIIYDKRMAYENGAAMYKKAIEYNPNNGFAYLNAGIGYYYGRGVVMDKYKAYNHWRIAARQGNKEAHNNLDVLCSKNPSVCK
ncbi:MAG: hypothetical protein A3J96_08380 [Sulfurimonas sp. RIFOXYC2_FULL_36_7]|nr:MAG: hypothetical protein A3J96_08380 [Sulfurimonas sp. RIFOXYC2_FULL_36_7]